MATSKHLAIVFTTAVILFLALTWESEALSIRERRDVESSTKNTTQVLEEAFESFKKGVDDFVKNVQNNELYQNVSQSLKTFGEQVQNQGKQLVDKIQQSTKNTPASN